MACAFKVPGMNDAQLQKVRALAGHAFFGPAFIADEYHLIFWLKAKWEEWVKPRAMALAFVHAQMHTETWQSDQGPDDAFLMTRRRLDWHAENWKVSYAEKKTRLALDDVGMGTLKKLVNQSTRRGLLEAMSSSRGMERDTWSTDSRTSD